MFGRNTTQLTGKVGVQEYPYIDGRLRNLFRENGVLDTRDNRIQNILLVDPWWNDDADTIFGTPFLLNHLLQGRANIYSLYSKPVDMKYFEKVKEAVNRGYAEEGVGFDAENIFLAGGINTENGRRGFGKTGWRLERNSFQLVFKPKQQNNITKGAFELYNYILEEGGILFATLEGGIVRRTENIMCGWNYRRRRAEPEERMDPIERAFRVAPELSPVERYAGGPFTGDERSFIQRARHWKIYVKCDRRRLRRGTEEIWRFLRDKRTELKPLRIIPPQNYPGEDD